MVTAAIVYGRAPRSCRICSKAVSEQAGASDRRQGEHQAGQHAAKDSAYQAVRNMDIRSDVVKDPVVGCRESYGLMLQDDQLRLVAGRQLRAASRHRGVLRTIAGRHHSHRKWDAGVLNDMVPHSVLQCRAARASWPQQGLEDLQRETHLFMNLSTSYHPRSLAAVIRGIRLS